MDKVFSRLKELGLWRFQKSRRQRSRTLPSMRAQSSGALSSRDILLGLSALVLITFPQKALANKFEQFAAEAEKAYQAKNYPEAQKNFELAIKEAEKQDKSDKHLATAVYNLALVFQAQGNYGEAEKNMLKSLDLIKAAYGLEHQRVAQVYMDLGDLYLEQAGQEQKPELKGKAAENYKKGTDVFEKIYNQLAAEETSEEGKEESEKSQKKSTKSDEEKVEKRGAQDAASDLYHALRLFADFYVEDDSFSQAEPYYKKALELEEYVSGPDDKDLARHKAKLAEMYCIQQKFPKAEPLFKQALEASEKSAADSAQLANILYNYGGLEFDLGNVGEAEVKFKRAFKIYDKLEGQDLQDIAQKRMALASALDRQGKADESEAEYKKCLDVFEKGNDKSVLIRGLKAYQQHLLMQNRKDEAGKIASRIKTLRAEK